MTRLERMKAENWSIAKHGEAGFCVKAPEGHYVFEDLKSMLLWQLEDDPPQRDLVASAFERAEGARA